MHEAAFSQAALPAPASVLGLELQPYSLGHELWLTREQNAFVSQESSLANLHLALPEAVLICCHRFSQVQAMNRDWLLGLKIRLWRRRIRKMNLEAELASFVEYRTRGSLEFPDEAPDRNGPCRSPGAPFLLRLNQFLITHLGKSEADAWDYPLGLAKMRYAAWLESEGALNVKNQYEIEFDRQYAEWDKNQKESGLKNEDCHA